MATSGGTILKELTHPSLNETLKTHNSVTFKLVKTGEYSTLLLIWIDEILKAYFFHLKNL
jgi:hypothetical protein